MPSLCYGLRGLAYFQIDVRGTNTDLHSGTFGGAVANPAMVLAQMLAQMKDRGGRIKIPGFYDDVRPLSDSERAEFKRLPFNETRYRKELGAPKLFGETGYTTLERTTRPAHVRGERAAERVHGRGREDRAAGRGDGQGEHAAGARTRRPRRSASCSRPT